MIGLLKGWIERRRAVRRRLQADASLLLQDHEKLAYYQAHHRAWRAYYGGKPAEFRHWAKVAAEVARRSFVVEMDATVVGAIAEEERLTIEEGGCDPPKLPPLRRRRPGRTRPY